VTALLRTFAALLLAMAALAGCGSDDEGGDGGGGGGDAAKQSPQQLLQASQDALGKVKSFHIEGTGTDTEDGEQKISGDFSIPGKMQVAIEAKSGKTELILADEIAYIRAPRAVWEEQGLPPQLLSAISDRWVKLPEDTDAAGEFKAYTNPETIGYCLIGKDLGTLSLGGTEEVEGKATNVVVDKGEKPGSSPGKLYIAAEGEPLPLRGETTGPKKPGGKPDPRCAEGEDDEDTTTRTDLTFSKYDEPVDIEAPADAVDIEELAAGAGQQSES
jgi:hypothetical protein